MAALTFLAGVLLVLAIVYGPRLWARRPRRNARMVECSVCWHELPARKAVVKATPSPMPDGIGGTAMVATYHRRCARRAGISQHP